MYSSLQFNCACKPVRNEQRCSSAFAAVQKIPESRSALQSGFEKTKNVVTGNALPLVSTKKRNAGSNNTIIMIHGRGVDKALVAE